MKNKLERYAYNINSNYVIQEGKDLYNNSKGNWHKIFNNKNPLVLELACGNGCLLYTSPSPRDRQKSRMPSSA